VAIADACPFERAIQSTLFGCSQSLKTFIGEKESVICSNPSARQDCVALVGQLKKNARFALQLNAPNGLLTHGQEMKLKSGGLQGLQEQSCSGQSSDVHELLTRAIVEFGHIEQLPYTELVKAISRYKLRRGS
jgi:hypothetical protein